MKRKQAGVRQRYNGTSSMIDEFDSLITLNEEKILLTEKGQFDQRINKRSSDFQHSTNNNTIPVEEENDIFSSDEEEIEEEQLKETQVKPSQQQTATTVSESKKDKYNLNDLKQLPSNNSKFYKIIVHLLTKNKISSKNAFDIEIPNLEELKKFDFSSYSAWKLLSSGLGAGAQIWGFKVDNTYGDTMKVLQKLFRVEAFDEEELKTLTQKHANNQAKNKKQLWYNSESSDSQPGSKTLEFHTNCLNADLYDLEFDKDPTFWRTSVNFDIKSAETMLLNKLPMDVDFGYVVDCEEKIMLRIDKRLEEIEEREEFGLATENPSLFQFLQPFVIRRKGLTVQRDFDEISMYSQLVSQVNKVKAGERSRHIAADITERMNSFKSIKRLSQIFDEGLCDDLTHYAQYIQQDTIFSQNTQRWQSRVSAESQNNHSQQQQLVDNLEDFKLQKLKTVGKKLDNPPEITLAQYQAAGGNDKEIRIELENDINREVEGVNGNQLDQQLQQIQEENQIIVAQNAEKEQIFAQKPFQGKEINNQNEFQQYCSFGNEENINTQCFVKEGDSSEVNWSIVENEIVQQGNQFESSKLSQRRESRINTDLQQQSQNEIRFSDQLPLNVQLLNLPQYHNQNDFSKFEKIDNNQSKQKIVENKQYSSSVIAEFFGESNIKQKDKKEVVVSVAILSKDTDEDILMNDENSDRVLLIKEQMNLSANQRIPFSNLMSNSFSKQLQKSSKLFESENTQNIIELTPSNQYLVCQDDFQCDQNNLKNIFDQTQNDYLNITLTSLNENDGEEQFIDEEYSFENKLRISRRGTSFQQNDQIFLENEEEKEGTLEENMIDERLYNKFTGQHLSFRIFEKDIEEEFNNVLKNDDEELINLSLFQRDSKFKELSKETQAIKTGQSFQFELDYVHLVEFGDQEPYLLIRRELGEEFFKTEEEILSERESCDKKYVWGYFSVSRKKEDNFENLFDQNKFDQKLFNIGKGTHRIDMRQKSGRQTGSTDILRAFINEGQEEDEFQMVQLSRLALHKPKDIRDTKRNRSKKSLNSDSNTINFFQSSSVENKQYDFEDYYCIVTPKMRGVQELITEKQSRKLRGNKTKKQQLIPLSQRFSQAELDRHLFNRNIMKKREILDILSSSAVTKDNLNTINQITEKYMIYLSEPSLREFMSCKTLETIFHDQDDLIMNISFDEIINSSCEDLQNNNTEDHFNQIESAFISDEIDYNFFDKGLYEALEIVQQPIYPPTQLESISFPILDTIHTHDTQNQQESQHQIVEQVSPKEELQQQEQQEYNLQEPSLFNHVDVALPQKSNSIKKNKKKKNHKKYSITKLKARLHALIDLDTLVSSEEEQDDLNNNDRMIKRQQQDTVNIQNQIVNNSEINSNEVQINIIQIEKQSESFSPELEIPKSSENSPNFEKYFNTTTACNEQEVQAYYQSENDENSVQQSSEKPIEISEQDEKSQSNQLFEFDFDILKPNRFGKTRLCFDQMNMKDIGEIDSCDSLDEQYQHSEFANTRVYNLDEHKMTKGDGEFMVKWEVKLEDMYEEIRSKHPYTDYTHLSPNMILLDRLRNAEELASQTSFLEELNNMNRFKHLSYFKSPLQTDYMGMAKKIPMKELMIRIWFNIKKQIKSSKEIQIGEKPFSFFDLILQIPNLIGKQNAENISLQTLFQVILHLGNLKNLRLIQNNENMNFYILSD